MSIVKKLSNYFRAGYPCLSIHTTEEQRACADILASAKQKDTGKKVMTWSTTEGLESVYPDSKRIDNTNDLLSALEALASIEDTVIVFRDVHSWPLDRDPLLARHLRDAMSKAPAAGNCIVLIDPSFKPYPAIEKMVTVIEYTLPDENDLREICKGIAESAGKKLNATDEVIKALSGLSTAEAENALALSIIETKKFSPEIIYREKVAAVKRSGLLEIVDPDPAGMDSIGGLENLKKWILTRKRAYSPEAGKYGLPSPKGVMLVGVPGNGKSLSAKAFGTALGIPTVKLDIGSLFNSLLGESEARTRDALDLAEAISPCCLWVDEVDKGLSGVSGNGSNDSGVTRRVFGTLLEWMQEKKKPVFLVMTANQVEQLPPEFLRRFDEIFAIDLPHVGERVEITSVVIKKLGRDPKNFDLRAIANQTDGCTGSEIEAVCTEALFAAFEKDREITTSDITAAAKEVIPLSQMMPEKIEAIRKWGKTRARPASFAEKTHHRPSTTSKRKLEH